MKHLGMVAACVAAAGTFLLHASPGMAQDEHASDPVVAMEGQSNASVKPLGYDPLFKFAFEGMELTLPIELAERLEQVSDITLDTDGTKWTSDPAWTTQVLVGAKLDTKYVLRPVHMVFEFEYDVVTGQHAGGVKDDSVGIFTPGTTQTESELRKASVRLDLGYHLHLQGGATVSHWGMGLLANDGHHGGTFKSATFSDPRGGDRVLRGMMILGPTDENKIALAIGVDRVLGDDVLQEGDEAKQAVASAVIGAGQPRHMGVYVVARTQESESGAVTNVGIVDLEGTYHRDLGQGRQIDLQFEGAYIFGGTDLGPSTDFPRHKVRQLGLAGRLGLHWHSAGLWVDTLYASGDNNFDDNVQSAFKADVNYPMGLIMHRYVIAAQTSRAPIVASDPNLVGQPAQDLNRLPTKGALTNTLSVFPRAYVTLWDRLEIFGGVLMALSDRDLSDPFQTRVGGGGSPRNALGGEPGSYLGTEFDIGMRYRAHFSTAEMLLGLEAGLFLPGDAFVNQDNKIMDPVGGGRAYLRFRL